MSKDYDAFKDIFLSLKKLFSRLFGYVRTGTDRLKTVGPKLRYRSSLYYRATARPYELLVRSKGAYGEYLLYDRLRRVKGRWLFNVYLPKKEETTEIDALLICKRGIFVFESKNFAGRIYGRADAKEWYQTVMTGKGIAKQRFFNPIMQNGAHKRALNMLIGEDCPVYPVVVFGRGCRLMIPPEEYDRNVMTTLNRLPSFLKRFRGGLSDGQIDGLYSRLLPYTQVSDGEKKKHIAYAKERYR